MLSVVETPYDQPDSFEAAAAGPDNRKHKYKARYRTTTSQETYSDGSAKIISKTELIENSLEDLGAVLPQVDELKPAEGNQRQEKDKIKKAA